MIRFTSFSDVFVLTSDIQEYVDDSFTEEELATEFNGYTRIRKHSDLSRSFKTMCDKLKVELAGNVEIGDNSVTITKEAVERYMEGIKHALHQFSAPDITIEAFINEFNALKNIMNNTSDTQWVYTSIPMSTGEFMSILYFQMCQYNCDKITLRLLQGFDREG